MLNMDDFLNLYNSLPPLQSDVSGKYQCLALSSIYLKKQRLV